MSPSSWQSPCFQRLRLIKALKNNGGTARNICSMKLLCESLNTKENKLRVQVQVLLSSNSDIFLIFRNTFLKAEVNDGKVDKETYKIHFS